MNEMDGIGKGYVIREHDLIDGRTVFIGRKNILSHNKESLTMGDTYTLSGAKRAVANKRRTVRNSDDYQYSIEQLEECYFGYGAVYAQEREKRERMEICGDVENAMNRLDELCERYEFNNMDKMRINEVRRTLRKLKGLLVK